MNFALLYRQNSQSIFWIAFMSALAIHVGAVALAKTKSPTAKPEDFSPVAEVDLVDTDEPEPPLVKESSKLPSPEQIHSDQDKLREDSFFDPSRWI